MNIPISLVKFELTSGYKHQNLRMRIIIAIVNIFMVSSCCPLQTVKQQL